MKIHKTSILTLSALFLFSWSVLAGSVSTNLWVLSFTGVCRATNDLGRIVTRPVNTSGIIADCLDNGQGPRGFALVYNPDQNDFEVVNRTNGFLVCTFITLSGGVSITNATGTLVWRQEYLYKSEQQIGSAEGTEILVYDDKGNVIRRHFGGTFQAGVPATDSDQPKVYLGRFSTSRRFLPIVR